MEDVTTVSDTPVTYLLIRYTDATNGAELGFIAQNNTVHEAMTWLHSLGITPHGTVDVHCFRTDHMNPHYLDRPITEQEWREARPEAVTWVGDPAICCVACATHPLV